MEKINIDFYQLLAEQTFRFVHNETKYMPAIFVESTSDIILHYNVSLSNESVHTIGS